MWESTLTLRGILGGLLKPKQADGAMPAIWLELLPSNSSLADFILANPLTWYHSLRPFLVVPRVLVPKNSLAKGASKLAMTQRGLENGIGTVVPHCIETLPRSQLTSIDFSVLSISIRETITSSNEYSDDTKSPSSLDGVIRTLVPFGLAHIRLVNAPFGEECQSPMTTMSPVLKPDDTTRPLKISMSVSYTHLTLPTKA